jgi:hypothetical protein
MPCPKRDHWAMNGVQGQNQNVAGDGMFLEHAQRLKLQCAVYGFELSVQGDTFQLCHPKHDGGKPM